MICKLFLIYFILPFLLLSQNQLMLVKKACSWSEFSAIWMDLFLLGYITQFLVTQLNLLPPLNASVGMGDNDGTLLCGLVFSRAPIAIIVGTVTTL